LGSVIVDVLEMFVIYEYTCVKRWSVGYYDGKGVYKEIKLKSVKVKVKVSLCFFFN
jgi:hypothetical protein